MKVDGFLKVMVVKEGKINRNGIFMTGLVDACVGYINKKHVKWIEEKPDLKHKEDYMVYVAKITSTQQIVVFRELDETSDNVVKLA